MKNPTKPTLRKKDQEVLKGLREVLAFMKANGVKRVELDARRKGVVLHESKAPCGWTQDPKTQVWKCGQVDATPCPSGSCKPLGPITFTDTNGNTKTVTYCECSGAP